jgi:hypothetical protein
MHNLTPKQQKRVITEFSSIEKSLDTVLFARDDDEEDGFPYLKTGAAVGAGAGLGLGVNALVKKGKRLNQMPAAQNIIPGLGQPGDGLSKGFVGDLKTGAKAFGKESAESLSALWKKLLGKTAGAAVKAV